jgi:hypothetical protein
MVAANERPQGNQTENVPDVGIYQRKFWGGSKTFGKVQRSDKTVEWRSGIAA